MMSIALCFYLDLDSKVVIKKKCQVFFNMQLDYLILIHLF